MSKFKLDTSKEQFLFTIKSPSGEDVKCYALNPEKMEAAIERYMVAKLKDAGILIES